MEEKKYKVLLVDDDKFLLNMYAQKFEKAGLEVNTAVNAREVLTKLKDGYIPDLVLLDIIMPETDGLELLADIRKQKLVPEATVIILTNEGDPAHIEKAKTLGSAGYIVKATSIPSEVVEESMKIFNNIKNKK